MKLHLSYSSEKTKIKVHDDVAVIKAFQIIVWMSLSSHRTADWDPRLLKFPAILDIGNNHNFAITRTHLLRWAGIHAESLSILKNVREQGEKIPLRSAALWLHTDDEPFMLDIEAGISMFDDDWPRLPILGLRALTNSKLHTLIYGDTKQVVIRTPPKWYWPF